MDNQTPVYALGGFPQQTPHTQVHLNPGTSLGQPPKCKLEAASDTPQKLRSPWLPLSDLHNPLSLVDIHIISNNFSKIHPPSLLKTVAEATSVSGSEHGTWTSTGLPLIDLNDCGVNTFCPSPSTPILACKTCGSMQQWQYVHAAGGEELHSVNLVMVVMQWERLSLGKFLSVIFDLQNRKSALLPSAHQKVDSFLKGHTKQGTQPVDIVRLIFKHEFSHDKRKGDQPMYHPLPSFACIPYLDNINGSPASAETSFYEHHDLSGEYSERALKQYFAQKVLEEMNWEMTKLVSDEMLRAGQHTALMWARVTSFSFTGIQKMVREKAPLLWSVLTMAATGPNVCLTWQRPMKMQSRKRGAVGVTIDEILG